MIAKLAALFLLLPVVSVMLLMLAVWTLLASPVVPFVIVAVIGYKVWRVQHHV